MNAHIVIDQGILRIRKNYLVILAILSVNILLAQQKTSREYQVKAVILFNFTHFVEWPTEAFSSRDSPLVIGVLGENPFGNYIEEAVRGEEINGHPLVVQRFKLVEEVNSCHILFVNLTKPDQLRQVFEKLKTQSTLTVGDANNFTRVGGMVGLFMEDSKTRIRINLEAAKEADLTISSKLLRLAEIVSPQNN